MDDFNSFFKPLVLITGFGPFLNHPVNASWEAVKSMNKEEIEKKHDVELVQLELSVTYENIDEFVPALWETHTPKLMIHVGVSRVADRVTLETQAHRRGYRRPDYLERCPAQHECAAAGAGRLRAALDVDRICADFNDDPPEGAAAVASWDAGRYVCEYTFYTSLSVDSSRTLFVHVPDLHVYSAARSARALERVLALALAQLAERDRRLPSEVE